MGQASKRGRRRGGGKRNVKNMSRKLTFDLQNTIDFIASQNRYFGGFQGREKKKNGDGAEEEEGEREQGVKCFQIEIEKKE